MTKIEFDALCKSVDARLGHLEMKWEGPPPHDFRDMEERGVRFVHSYLFAHSAPLAYLSDADTDYAEYAPGGTVKFKIHVGDDAAASQVGDLLTAAGYQWTRDQTSQHYSTITFEVAA